ncbi:type II secretion system protein GspK [Puniceicoccus vermicola]|uniref:General secretion pathway protein GspK n=1 Tax=Puniceicoccus vermicola TaxID=388746 RepID=A0A7X1E5J5_9BACT|nr:type II secretion system protein GspK [Puniceicoccus vermicola]MBC2603108.1 general secretion pathway protein GspK [Puniceicoccus vermicola]
MNFRQGGVLLVVLGVLAAMGMVVSLLASYALERSLLAETRGGESRSGVGLRLSSAIEAGMASLHAFEEIAEGLHDPSEGWGRPAELLSGWPTELDGIEVQIFDESNRPGLSLLGEDQLLDLLEESGFSKGEASELRDLLLDWMDEDDDERYQGRENSNLGRGRDPWVPNRMPKSWNEIWSIPEWGEAAFDGQGALLPWAEEFSSRFSLDHDSPANINSVDREMVEWLHDADVISYPSWLDERDGIDNEEGTENDRVLTELPGGEDGEMGELFSSESQVLRIRASLLVGERYVWKEAWIAKDSEGEEQEGQRPEPVNSEEGEAAWGNWKLIDVREGLSLVLDDEKKEG